MSYTELYDEDEYIKYLLPSLEEMNNLLDDIGSDRIAMRSFKSYINGARDTMGQMFAQSQSEETFDDYYTGSDFEFDDEKDFWMK